MLKLIMFFIILALVVLLYISFRGLFKESNKDESLEPGDIDAVIQQLKSLVSDFELKVKQGVEDAEAKLADYKEQLKKAELFKTKTNNL